MQSSPFFSLSLIQKTQNEKMMEFWNRKLFQLENWNKLPKVQGIIDSPFICTKYPYDWGQNMIPRKWYWISFKWSKDPFVQVYDAVLFGFCDFHVQLPLKIFNKLKEQTLVARYMIIPRHQIKFVQLRNIYDNIAIIEERLSAHFLSIYLTGMKC